MGKTSVPLTLGLEPIVPVGGADGYVAKLSNSHDSLWAVHLPSSDRSNATACALDPRGNLIVGGSFDGDVRLSPTGQVHSATAGTFVAKYDAATGEQLWETVGTGEADVQAVATDSVGRAVASYLVKTEPVTIDGETYPGSDESSMLLLQFAP